MANDNTIALLGVVALFGFLAYLIWTGRPVATVAAQPRYVPVETISRKEIEEAKRIWLKQRRT